MTTTIFDALRPGERRRHGGPVQKPEKGHAARRARPARHGLCRLPRPVQRRPGRLSRSTSSPIGRATQFNDDLIQLREQATLVFLNGCHTGSVGIDLGTYNDGALRGFAKVFLRSGAAGVLATTGAVGRDEARVLADDLLKHLRVAPGAVGGRGCAPAPPRRRGADDRGPLADRSVERGASSGQTENSIGSSIRLCTSISAAPGCCSRLTERAGQADTGELAGTGGQP